MEKLGFAGIFGQNQCVVIRNNSDAPPAFPGLHKAMGQQGSARVLSGAEHLPWALMADRAEHAPATSRTPETALKGVLPPLAFSG